MPRLCTSSTFHGIPVALDISHSKCSLSFRDNADRNHLVSSTMNQWHDMEHLYPSSTIGRPPIGSGSVSVYLTKSVASANINSIESLVPWLRVVIARMSESDRILIELTPRSLAHLSPAPTMATRSHEAQWWVKRHGCPEMFSSIRPMEFEIEF
jgi:hypothetical protein